MIKANDIVPDYIVLPGFQVGINAERNLGKHFCFGIGLEFAIMKHGFNDMALYYDSKNIDTLALLDYEGKDNNLQIPLYFKYILLKERDISPYIKLGLINTFVIKSEGQFSNVRIVKEDFDEFEYDYYHNIFFKDITEPEVENFSEIYDNYQTSLFLSAGLSANIYKKIFIGFDVSFQVSQMFLFLNGFAGINF